MYSCKVTATALKLTRVLDRIRADRGWVQVHVVKYDIGAVGHEMEPIGWIDKIQVADWATIEAHDS